MKEILLIGCGHMGNALLASWMKSKDYNLTVVDPLKYKLLKNKINNKKIKLFKNIFDLDNLLKFNFIILAIKPKDFDNLLSDLSTKNLNKNTSVVSIVAGKKIKLLEKKFKKLNNFYRVMPNMPAYIGESMNCIISSKKAKKINSKNILKLFSYSGKTIFLNNEKQIDMATAVSGSGPGFIFSIIDSIEKAAIKLGFNKEISNLLVLQTFKGSIDLLLKNNFTAENLVKTVATKGGTTEAGLQIMKKNKLQKVFFQVTNSAYKKAKEQGK